MGNSITDCQIGSDKQKSVVRNNIYARVYTAIKLIFEELPHEFTREDLKRLSGLKEPTHKVLPIQVILRRSFFCTENNRVWRKPTMTKKDYSIAEQNKQDVRIYVGRNPGKSIKEISVGLGWQEKKVSATLKAMKNEIYNGIVLKPIKPSEQLSKLNM